MTSSASITALGWFAVAGVLLSQWVAGRVCLAWLCPAGATGPWRRSLPRALLLGPAALTVQMGAFHLVGLPLSLPAVLAPWWLGALWWRRRIWPPRSGAAGTAGTAERALLVVVLAVTAAALVLALATPVHTADGLNNFALPARVFATHPDLAPDRLATLSLPGHLEYPPLVALNESLFMRAARLGAPDEAGLLAVKPFFVLPVLAFLLLAVELCFGRLQALAAVPATLLVVLIPTLLATPTAGMADLHLTAALLLLALEGAAFFGRAARPSRPPAPLLAAAAVCALTKDEGVAVAVVTGLALVVVAWRTRRPGDPRRGALLGGATLLLALAWSWRAWLTWHGIEFETTLAWPTGGAAAALDRAPRIVAHFASLLWSYAPGGVSPWGLLWPCTLAVTVLSLATGGRAARRALLWPALLLAAHVSLYVGVYAFNTQPLEWVLGNSAPRLFMHLLPWALLLLVAALTPTFGRRAAPPT